MTNLYHNQKTAVLTFLLAGAALLLSAGQAAEVTADAIKVKVTTHVQEKLKTLVSKEDTAYMTIDVVQVPGGPFNFPKTEDARQITINMESPLGEMYSERAVVRVRMESSAGDSAREIGVPVRIVIKKPVWVVKNVIPANAPVSPADLELKTREISHEYVTAVGRERDLRNYVARVNLRPGETLDSRKIIIPPDVTANNDVRILLKISGMTVTVPGVALSSGRIGETIRVRQDLYQRKAFQAKIIDKNRVLVEM